MEDWIAHHARFSPGPRRRTIWRRGGASPTRSSTSASRGRRLWLARRVRRAAGDRVAVLSMNDTDVFELQFACRRLGAIFLPLNWRLAVPELEFICQGCRAGRADPRRRSSPTLRSRWRGWRACRTPPTSPTASPAPTRRGTRGGQRHARSAGARSRRHLDHHVHVGHDRAAEGRADHLPDVRVQRHPVRHDDRADRAIAGTWCSCRPSTPAG